MGSTDSASPELRSEQRSIPQTPASSIPDPFLADDDAIDSEQNNVPLVAPQPVVPVSAKSIASLPEEPLNINKDVPLTPQETSDEETQEDDKPDIELADLVSSSMFLPIPNTDPLNTLLSKYIYPPEARPVRDVSGEWQQNNFHALVMTNSWRALARMARDRLVNSNPADLALVLGLWYLRIACLARLRLFNQAAAECSNLFTILNSISPESSRVWLFDNVLPFELEVMQTRLRYWYGDHMGYLDSLSVLLRKCKMKARLAAKARDDTTVEMWRERGTRICLIIASQLVDMKDFSAATKMLEPLCANGNPGLQSAVARIYLQAGYLEKATKYFDLAAASNELDESAKHMDAALLASAQGDWDLATTLLGKALEEDAENYAAVNNLSVTLLNQGNLKAAIEVLEKALLTSPSSVVVAEPVLFNLATLYELRFAAAIDKKRALLVEVAKWSGDGLRTTCLKMPSN